MPISLFLISSKNETKNNFTFRELFVNKEIKRTLHFFWLICLLESNLILEREREKTKKKKKKENL